MDESKPNVPELTEEEKEELIKKFEEETEMLKHKRGRPKKEDIERRLALQRQMEMYGLVLPSEKKEKKNGLSGIFRQEMEKRSDHEQPVVTYILPPELCHDNFMSWPLKDNEFYDRPYKNFGVEKCRTQIMSDIANMGVAQIRKALSYTRKYWENHSPNNIFLPSHPLPEYDMSCEEFNLHFVIGHHKKRHNKGKSIVHDYPRF